MALDVVKKVDEIVNNTKITEAIKKAYIRCIFTQNLYLEQVKKFLEYRK